MSNGNGNEISLNGKFEEDGYFPIACGVMDFGKHLNGLWFVDGSPSYLCPDNWRNYIYKMIDYCCVEDIKVRINGNRSESIILYAKSANMDIDCVVKKCKEFNGAWEMPPFQVTRYAPFNKGDIVDKKNVSTLKSYFDSSMFNALIRYPNGSNIAPFNNYERHTWCYNYGANINITGLKKISDYHLLISGSFYTKDVKGKNGQINYCVVCDSGDFTSTVTCDERGVSIRTVASVSRQIDGNNFEKQNIRDLFWGTLESGETISEFSCTEYFFKFANGRRLLHYSDDSDYFEVFELASGWSILDGITKDMYANKKLFNDDSFDEHDPDIKEIYEILDSRNNLRGKV